MSREEVSIRSTEACTLVLTLTDITTLSSPFLFLALDLPATPLFQDQNEKKIIPQVPLSTILAKFDGQTTQVRLPYHLAEYNGTDPGDRNSDLHSNVITYWHYRLISYFTSSDSPRTTLWKREILQSSTFLYAE